MMKSFLFSLFAALVFPLAALAQQDTVRHEVLLKTTRVTFVWCYTTKHHAIGITS